MESDIKLLLKITDPDTNMPLWVHLCYADEAVYKDYLLKHPHGGYMNAVISKWAKQDFDVELTMDTNEDLNTLKNLVKEKYKEKYPEVYRDSNTDRQGWLRLWLNNKMKEESTDVNG